MKNLQLPGSLQAGDLASFGGPYPVDDHATGLNNTEWNAYPAATNNRIYPVQHPLDPGRPVSVSYTVKAGDQQPHYGASGERSELWPEPHDSVEGVADAICSSWVIPADHQAPTGWCLILQLHPGEPPYPNDWNWPIVNLANDEISVQFEYEKKVFGPATRNREFYVAFETLLKYGGGGYYRAWVSWDKPPNTSAAPFLQKTGATLLGTPMYWKTGLYRNKEPFTSRVVQTTLARRPTLSAAIVAAGWDKNGGTPPPPQDSLPVTSTEANGVLTLRWTPVPGAGYELWIDDTRQKSFSRDPGKNSWQVRKLPGQHKYEVRAVDYGVSGSVVT